MINYNIMVEVYRGHHLTQPVLRLSSPQTGTVMQVTVNEWKGFIESIKAGRWDDFLVASIEDDRSFECPTKK